MAFCPVPFDGDRNGAGYGDGLFPEPCLSCAYGGDSGDCDLSVSGFVQIYDEAVVDGKAFVCHGCALHILYGADPCGDGVARMADVFSFILYDDFGHTGGVVLCLYIHD